MTRKKKQVTNITGFIKPNHPNIGKLMQVNEFLEGKENILQKVDSCMRTRKTLKYILHYHSSMIFFQVQGGINICRLTLTIKN